MDRDELIRWLCAPDALPPSPWVVAQALGLSASELADTTLLRVVNRVESLRLTLAVVRDAFPADMDVWRWLETPRVELGGASPREALVSTPMLVEALAVQTWNEVASVSEAV